MPTGAAAIIFGRPLDPKFDPAVIMQIIEMIMGVIDQCPKKEPDQLKEEIRNPGPFTQYKLKKLADKKEISCTADDIAHACSFGADLSDLELEMMVTDAWSMF